MRRDWDVIRKVMIRVEQRGHNDPEVKSDDFAPIDSALVAYSMHLLMEAGLAEGGGRSMEMVNAPPHAFLFRLTWEGHELLDEIRNDTAWSRIKALAKDKSIDLTVDAIKVLAKAVLEHLLRGGS